MRDGHTVCAPPCCHLHQALGFLSCLLQPPHPHKPLLSHNTTWGESDQGDHESPDPFPRATGEAKGEKTYNGRPEQRPFCVLLLGSWPGLLLIVTLPSSRARVLPKVTKFGGFHIGFCCCFVLVLKRAAFGLTVRDASRALPRRWWCLQILAWLKRVP